jgi:hypothetical protein
MIVSIIYIYISTILSLINNEDKRYKLIRLKIKSNVNYLQKRSINERMIGGYKAKSIKK